MEAQTRQILIPSRLLKFTDDFVVQVHSLPLEGGTPANLEGRPLYDLHVFQIYRDLIAGRLQHWMETKDLAEIEEIQKRLKDEYPEQNFDIYPHDDNTVDTTVRAGDELVTYGLNQPSRYTHRRAIFQVLEVEDVSTIFRRVKN